MVQSFKLNSLFVVALLISSSFSAVISRIVSNTGISTPSSTITYNSQGGDFSSVQSLQVSITMLFYQSLSSNQPQYGTASYAAFSLQLVGAGASPTINLINANTFQYSAQSPGIVIMNFSDDALLLIDDVNFPYTGSFRSTQPLSAYNGLTSLQFTATTSTPTNFNILSLAVTVNCNSRNVPLYTPNVVPYASLPKYQIPNFANSVSNSRAAYETTVNYFTGLNTRITGILVHIYGARVTNTNFVGLGATCNYLTYFGTNLFFGSTTANFADAAIYLQYFPDNGPATKFVLDSGIASGISSSTWTGTLPNSGATTEVAFTYYVVQAPDTAPTSSTATNGGFYRAPSTQTNPAALLGLAPYGRWVVTMSDTVNDSNYWCIDTIQLEIQTCQSTGANVPCC